MAYVRKTWKGRQGTGLNKFSIDGAAPVTVVNQPDTLTEAGDALSAGNLNDWEGRIGDEFTNVNNEIDKLKDGTTPAAKATKAYSDEDGNNIKTTYATKSELQTHVNDFDALGFSVVDGAINITYTE